MVLREVVHALTSHFLVLGSAALALPGSLAQFQSQVQPQTNSIRISCVHTMNFDVASPACLPFCAIANIWSTASWLPLLSGSPLCFHPLQFGKAWLTPQPSVLLHSHQPFHSTSVVCVVHVANIFPASWPFTCAFLPPA